MQGIWKVWMTVWCAIAIILGLELAGAALPSTDFGARVYVALISGFVWEGGLFDAPGMRFAVGVMGAILLGWGVTMLVLVRTPGLPGALWRGVTAAMVLWFAVDSALSMVTGYPINAAINAVFLATYLVPLVASGALRSGSGPLTRALG
ncbi:MAG: hypothetical protein P1U88_13825 [Thalassobaculaceae bacterium]|nr:hypothetical protein [Thalassobaculaceae bacterium]